MIVDVFCHLISSSVGSIVENGRRARERGVTAEAGPRRFPFPRQNEDPETRLSVMERCGIDVQAVSLTMEALYGFEPAEAAEICRLSNNDNYALCKAYPKRFVNVCAISLLDVPSAMTELHRSINELDCRAVVVATNQNGKGLDSPEYFPFYEVLVEHDLPLLLHPTYWRSYPLMEEEPWMLMSRFGWPLDTTQAVWRLIFGGVLDRFPSLKIVMHHLGGMFPYFAGRIQFGLMRLREKLPRDMSEYWKNVYGDSCLSGGPPEAYACGYAFFGPDRVVYGSDYPFGPESGETFVRTNLSRPYVAANIPAEDMEKVLRGNAKRLLKIA